MCKIYHLLTLSLAVLLFGAPACQQNSPNQTTAKKPDIMLTTESEEARTAVQNGLEFLDLNNGAKARQAFTAALEKDPNFAMAYLFRSYTSGSAQEFADDIMAAAAHIEGASKAEEQLVAHGMSYLNNNWDQRLEISLRLSQDFPDIARFQTMLGNTYQEGNQIDKARSSYQKAIDLAPNWPGGYFFSMNSYLFNEPKDFDKAEAMGRKLVELTPNSSAAQISLGDCYRAKKELLKARNAYAKATELDPNDPVAYTKKGHTDTFLGNMEDARNAFRESAKLSNNKIQPACFEAYTWLYAGEFQKGLDELLKMANNPQSLGLPPSQMANAKSRCLDDAAMVAFQQGQSAKLEELIPQLSAALMAEVENLPSPELKAALQAYLLEREAVAAAQGGKFDVAGQKLEKAKTLLGPLKDPTKMNGYYFAQGYLYLQQKQYAQAVAQLEKENLDDVYNKYWLAKAYEMAGEKEKALKTYQSIVDHNFNDIGYALIRAEVKKRLTPS